MFKGNGLSMICLIIPNLQEINQWIITQCFYLYFKGKK